MLKRFFVSTLVFALCLQTGSANAQRRQTASQHYQTASQHFSRHEFSEAAREFRTAYELSHNADLLYNIARSLEQAQDFPGALAAYRQFRDAGSPHGDPAEIERSIRSLEERTTRATPVVTPVEPALPTVVATPTPAAVVANASTTVRTPHPATRPAPVPRMSGLHRYGPWITLGLGTALGIAAVPFAVSAANNRSTLTSVANGSLAYTDEAENARTSLSGNSATAIALGVAGGAALIGGVAWMLVRPHAPSTERAPALQPVLGWNNIGVIATF